MGQYQKHLYGSTLYGEIAAFFGQYTTQVFDAEEPFTGKIEHTLTCQLPYATYRADTYETDLIGSWTLNANKQAISGAATDTFKFLASGRIFEFKYLYQKTKAQTIHLELKKKDGTVVQQYDVNTYSLTSTGVGTYVFSDVPYETYTLEGKITSGGDIPFTLDSFRVLTSDVSVEMRASSDLKTWTEWEEVSNTYSMTNNVWKIKGTSTSTYTGVRFAQARLTLITSEQTSAPVVDKVELLAGDSSLRETDGIWTAVLNMESIASASAKKFAKATKIRWTANEPANTTMTIRSSSTPIGEFFGAITAPYRKNTKRLRLKDATAKHSVVIGPIDPTRGKDFWKVLEWREWFDYSYLPKDTTGVKVTYIFSKTKKDREDPGNLLQKIEQPMTTENKKLLFSPQPFYVTIVMEKMAQKGTPVVDMVNLYSNIEYKESIPVEDKVTSAVDNENKGFTRLQAVSDIVFKEPKTTNELPYNVDSISNVAVDYVLTDATRRPTDVYLYYKSEEKLGARSNRTQNKADEIYAQVIVRKLELGQKTGVLEHFQYSGGSVQYLRPHTEEMSPDFTPSLLNSKKYKYYIINGWPQESHVVQTGEKLEDIANMYGVDLSELKQVNPKIQYGQDGSLSAGQILLLPNHSLNENIKVQFENNSVYTLKSSHNGRLDKVTDLSSEKVVASVPTSPTHNYVDWVSEEKIYDGVINHNDIRGAYIRTQYHRPNSTSLERPYIVSAGDTWDSIAKKFEISVDDLKVKNPVELKEGIMLTIPPNILLPEIPQGVEFEGAMPYELVIVDNSVHKKDGSPLDKSWIPVDWQGKHMPITVVYKTSSPVTVEITRGSVRNDKDALAHNQVIQILACKKADGTPYQPWDTDLQIGDYKLNGDYIDWSPAKDESREPLEGEKYFVTYTHKEVDYATVQLDTTYLEETGVDFVWRSPEIKVLEGICSPEQDVYIPLPDMSTFDNYGDRGIKDYEYLVEDNDLWVETSVVDYQGKPHILGTMKNRNPKENWHPRIKTGFYYLKEDEYYMYSESLVTELKDKDVPIAKNVIYQDGTIVIEPKRENFISNSTLENKTWKTAGTFTFKTN